MSLVEYSFKLTSCTWLNPRVKHFSGEITANDWSFVPGQFITLIFDHEGKSLKRSYSIANPPQGKTIEFAASFVEGGPGSAYLFSRQVGDELKILGPYGRLILKPPFQFPRLWLVATSTGITPYRSMLPQLAQILTENPNFQVEIIQGVQKQEDLLFAKDFINLSKRFPQQVQFTAALSRETPKDNEGYPIVLGHVQQVFTQKQPNPATDLVYLCGNPQMIDETTALLQSENFDIQQIIREKYISR